eukprot:3030418-Rhodomonas_salina.1
MVLARGLSMSTACFSCASNGASSCSRQRAEVRGNHVTRERARMEGLEKVQRRFGAGFEEVSRRGWYRVELLSEVEQAIVVALLRIHTARC